MLGAMAYGASQVARAGDGQEPRRLHRGAASSRWATPRRSSTRSAMPGEHFAGDRGPGAELWESRRPRRRVAKAATFNLSPEKRTTLDFALDHLAQAAKPKTIPLPAGAPFGALTVNKQTCTLCKACIGACPESALLDSHRDAERCASSSATACSAACARTPAPRTRSRWCRGCCSDEQAKEPVTLNEAEPFNCVRCAKPFGTRQMVENMTRQARRRIRCSPAAARSGGCRCAATAAWSTWWKTRTETSIFDYTDEVSAPLQLPRPRTRRAPTSTA